jgi:hypothetical protein
MRIGLIIADWEMSFTTSFIHTASKKYNVDFSSSKPDSIREGLQRLKANMEAGNFNNLHVGYDFNIQEVERIEQLLLTLIQRYQENFGHLPANRKLYDLLPQLQKAETPTPEQIAKDIVNDIFKPWEKGNVASKEEQLKEDAEAKSKERAFNLLKKINAKKSKK